MNLHINVETSSSEISFRFINELTAKCSLIDGYITNKYHKESTLEGVEKVGLLDFIKTNVKEIFLQQERN